MKMNKNEELKAMMNDKHKELIRLGHHLIEIGLDVRWPEDSLSEEDTIGYTIGRLCELYPGRITFETEDGQTWELKKKED